MCGSCWKPSNGTEWDYLRKDEEGKTFTEVSRIIAGLQFLVGVRFMTFPNSRLENVKKKKQKQTGILAKTFPVHIQERVHGKRIKEEAKLERWPNEPCLSHSNWTNQVLFTAKLAR